MLFIEISHCGSRKSPAKSKVTPIPMLDRDGGSGSFASRPRFRAIRCIATDQSKRLPDHDGAALGWPSAAVNALRIRLPKHSAAMLQGIAAALSGGTKVSDMRLARKCVKPVYRFICPILWLEPAGHALAHLHINEREI
jgi:hypothetical protein